MTERVPKHVAIIMDGNGRWANQRSLPRIAGHRAGAKVVRPIVEYCAKAGVSALSLFAFSLENRGRPPAEVQFLMKLLLKFLQRDTVSLHENNVRLRVIGDKRYLDAALLSQVNAAEGLTKQNTGLNLLVAINYSGRWDLAQAAQKVIQKKCKGSEIDSLEEIEKQLEAELSFSGLPDPDLLVRTSGEQRISNFMLWQLAYSEIYFTPTLWPDFTVDQLKAALDFYRTRERRFGLVLEPREEYAET